MMEDRPDVGTRREVDPHGYPAAPATRSSTGYLPAIGLLVLLLIGGFFLITSGNNQQTASNAPAPERSTPAPAPAAPPTTPPVKQQ